jgi:hypothetical protein
MSMRLQPHVQECAKPAERGHSKYMWSLGMASAHLKGETCGLTFVCYSGAEVGHANQVDLHQDSSRSSLSGGEDVVSTSGLAHSLQGQPARVHPLLQVMGCGRLICWLQYFVPLFLHACVSVCVSGCVDMGVHVGWGVKMGLTAGYVSMGPS